MTTSHESPAGTTGGFARRQVLQTLAALGVGGATLTVVSGCGSSQKEDTASPDLNSVDPGTLSAVAAAMKSGEVQVGQAKFFNDKGVILTHPSKDSYRLYSDVCPHQGGKVTTVSGKGHLVCPLHGSEFDAATGEAVVGPAGTPLAGKNVKAQGDTATLS